GHTCPVIAPDSAAHNKRPPPRQAAGVRAESFAPGLRLAAIRVEVERRRVDAVALSGRSRAVIKQVPQMRAAVRAAHLGADHPVAAVLAQLDVLLIDRIPEARPAAAGLVLRLRAEQRLVADDAAIQPLLVVVVVHTAE